MKEIRCVCGRLLFKSSGITKLEIKCPKCEKITFIDVDENKELEVLVKK